MNIRTNPRLHVTALLGLALFALALAPRTIRALEQPWISDVFFYWYEWDAKTERGNWINGVHNTPLQGYYDSRTFRDNFASLKTAGEWGITHHFIDYWGHPWLDEKGRPREKIVFEAAEALRKKGYDIWMGFYQDGNNFAMDSFAKNLSEHRDTEFWLREFAHSPVWPLLNGRPVQLVYGRNGRPELPEDEPAYRQWLHDRYTTLEAVNREWKSQYKSFDDIQLQYGGLGPERADAVAFAFSVWHKQWTELDGLVQKAFGFPGIAASFDVGYVPFRGLGYVGLTRTFCGPHSYGGIFGPPEDRDVERFIQAQVAKHFDSVFFDHFKNYYHDWDIRIPGFAYLPDPVNFDRFWAGALMRRSEALLHLSWNEWWEGSNLEPSHEFSKKYCEKNLFYATVMKRCFPDIRSAWKRAPVAVLLNDYAFCCGTTQPEDEYRIITTLRRLNVPFDLFPDAQATPTALARFEVIIAPACGQGFGRNDRREHLLPMLFAWAKNGGKLVISRDTDFATALGLREVPPPETAAANKPGPDLNVFADVGTNDDSRFLISGYSRTENWGKLPENAFGAGKGKTVRWTPASGNTTRLRLPCSPARDHILRLAGSAIWGNQVRVLVNGRSVGRFAIEPGDHEYSIRVPATAIDGRPMADIALVYRERNIPGKKDPKRFGTEPRVCNLALDWVQFSTDNVPAHTRKQNYRLPESTVAFTDPVFGSLRGRNVPTPYSDAPWLRTALSGSRILSHYADGRPRDILVRQGKGTVLYVNGSFADFATATETAPNLVPNVDIDLWTALLTNLCAAPPPRFVTGPQIGGERLRAGTTDVLPVINYNGDALNGQPTRVRLSVPTGRWPLAEAVVLSRDAETSWPRGLNPVRRGNRLEASDTVRWYAVYAFVHAPAALEIPGMKAVPGETVTVPVTIRNLTDAALSGTLRLTSVIPTLTGEPVAFTCPAGKEKTATVNLPVRIAESADWGRKTVTVELDWGAKTTAYFFRPFIVQKLPELEFTPVLLGRSPGLQVHYTGGPTAITPPVREIRIIQKNSSVADNTIIMPGQTRTFGVMGPRVTRTRIGMASKSLRFTYLAGSRRIWRKLDLTWPALPEKLTAPSPDAVPLLLWNPTDTGIGPIAMTTRQRVKRNATWHVTDTVGCPIPSQTVAGTHRPHFPGAAENQRLIFPGVAPARSARLYWLVPGKAPAAPHTDLTCRVEGKLGSGSGRVIIENSWYSIILDEAAGGTMTRLVSKRTGRNYARHSFDFSFGRFSKPGHPHPRCSTAQLIDEKKTRLSDQPHALKLTRRGPLWLQVESQAVLGAVTCTTRYEFVAYQPMFRVVRNVQRSRGPAPEEIVVLDSDIAPNSLRKSFPGFAGIPAPAPKCQYGWRYSDWVPPDITLIPANPQPNTEAITLHVVRERNIDRVRQGFWPENRPKPGPRATAKIEYICRNSDHAELDIRVRLHTGWQLQGRRWFDAARDLRLNRVDLPKSVQAPAPVPADWWCTAWTRRECITVRREQVRDGLVSIRIGGRESPVPGSVRLIGVGEDALRELPCTVGAEARTVFWRVAPQGPWPRRYQVYWLPANSAESVPASSWAVHLVRRSFPFADDLRQPDGWQLSGVARLDKAGKGGAPALFFDTAKNGPRVAVCERALPEPGTPYRMRFTAKALGEKPVLSSNLYAGPKVDGPQVHTPLKADGAWHEYTVVLPALEFPADNVPRFRFWTLPGDFRVWLADVRIDRAGTATATKTAAHVPPLEAPVEELPTATE